MHVIHLISGLEGGGAEGALYRLLSHETAAGRADSHTVISFTDRGVYGADIASLGVPLECLGMRRGTLRRSSRGRSPIGGLVRLYHLLRAFPRTSVVQTWMYHADLLGGVVARLAGHRRIVWGIRHSTLDRRDTSLTLRAIARASAILSGFIPRETVSCSSRAAEVHTQYGYRGPFTIVANGYDLSELRRDSQAREQLRQEWGVASDIPLLGMVARYNPQKDHRRLLAAFAALVKHAEKPRLRASRLVLVGEGCDANNGDLKRLLEQTGTRARVILAGRRADIPAVMSALDVHVLSSSSGEAFPNVLAEAMACGTPCVATDVGDSGEIIGETGWLVPPRNTVSLYEALHSALREQLDDPTASASRSEAGITRVTERFSLDAMASGFRAVWQRVGRIRVDLVAPSMRGGGAERVLSHLAQGLDRTRFSLRLLLLQATGPFLSAIPEDVTIVDLRASRARYALFPLIRALRGRGECAPTGAGTPWTPRGRSYSRPDIVLSTLGYVNLLVAIAHRLLPRSTRFVAREANTVSISNATQAHPWMLNALYRMFYRRFDAVICQSRYMARDLTDNYRMSPEKCVIIPNPVNSHEVRSRAWAADSPASERLQLLTVGRLVPQKGIDILLAAIAQTRRPLDLTVVGDGAHRQELIELARQLGILAQVTFAGFQSDPYALMGRSDCLVLPSRYEGLPNVVLEAGAAGLPVIAFDCPGGTTEIVKPGRNGVLVKCGNTNELANAIERFDTTAWDSEEISTHIESHYGLKSISERYGRVLEQIACQPIGRFTVAGFDAEKNNEIGIGRTF